MRFLTCLPLFALLSCLSLVEVVAAKPVPKTLKAKELAPLPKSLYDDWHVRDVNAKAAWKKGVTGRRVRIAIVDTGIGDHKFLNHRVLATKDFTGEGDGDVHTHGTHVAGIAISIAPDADLLVAKVMDLNGRGDFESIRQGIEWAIRRDADVINLSLGGRTDDAAIAAVLADAASKGIMVIAAVGNKSGEPVGFPARHPDVFAVRAMDRHGRIARFSNDGPEIRVAAPGVDVDSCEPGGGWVKHSGTSMAAPCVSGVAALWCQDDADKESRPVRFDKWLRQTARRDLTPDAGAVRDIVRSGDIIGFRFDLRVRR